MKILVILSFIEKLEKTLLSIIKIVAWSKCNKNTLPKPTRSECIIIGNGPSLSDTIEQHKAFFTNKDLICVNYFPKDEIYSELKPRYYINVSPSIWEKNVKEKYRNGHIENFKQIANKTEWELGFIVPALSKNTKEWKQDIIKNPNIKIQYINTTPIEGFHFFENLMFRFKIGMPRPHNVLIPSILVAINLGYKTIYITGADHSWLKDVWVDEDNSIIFVQKHFYKGPQLSDKKISDHKKNGKLKKLHELLLTFVHTFSGYHTLQRYAKTKNIKIINLTKDSYIDAFDRLKL